MQVSLEVVRGPHQGRSFFFEGHDNFIVGRATCAHFRLPRKDPFFSRLHFMIEINPPLCLLVDLGSSNGTWVNEKRVKSAYLQHGDRIRGGDTVLEVKFSEPQKAPSIPPPPPPTPAVTESFLPVPERKGIVPPPQRESRAEDTLPTIAGYKIIRVLGRGGMGVVYLATRLSDGVDVALKTIRPAVNVSERRMERFLREASILQRLVHPNIVAFHEMGFTGELLYFAMDHVPGQDTRQLLTQHGPLPIPHALGLIGQTLEALQYAHGQGFVHRDVKPANLLTSGRPGAETCKLADFGLARVYHASPLSGLTMLGDAGGTIPFMPPEQITHYRDVSPAADQYSTAATLYTLLTGQFPFDFGEAPNQQRLTKILLEQPVPIRQRRADIPEGLAQEIHRALRKEPRDRFPDVAAFGEALAPFGNPG